MPTASSNVSYPLLGLDVGCPDVFPCGGKICVIATYCGPPGGPHSHMQDQWWVGEVDMDSHTFVPEQTELLDFGNHFAGKTGAGEVQTGGGRRVLFGFPGWTQTT